MVRYNMPGGVNGFDLWWSCCVAIASAGPAFCCDMDRFVILDVAVSDLLEAEERYRLRMWPWVGETAHHSPCTNRGPLPWSSGWCFL